MTSMRQQTVRTGGRQNVAPLLWGCVLLIATAVAWTLLGDARSPAALSALGLVTLLTVMPLLGIRALMAWRRHHPGAALAWVQRAVRVRRRYLPGERELLAALLQLTPARFELAVARLLPALGFTDVEHTGGGGDLGADIVCRGRNGERIVVQCKRYAPEHLVGSPEVQQFIGMVAVHHKAARGIFVTTSGYTQPARDLAAQHPQLTLIDGAGLARLAARVRRRRR